MSIDYIMESGEEILRLDKKTDEEIAASQARRAGLGPGMSVADICCGSGKTTSILRAVAGEGGSAVGIDGSRERIAHAQATYTEKGTRFVCRDIRSDLSDIGSFDFVWVRFILEYFRAEAFEIVRNLTRIVKKGGILCLIDLDHNCLNHYGISPRLEEAVTSSLAQLEEKGNFDPYAGRKLYSHLYRLGYEEIGVDAGAHHLIYGTLKESDGFNWIKKIEVLSEKLNITLPGYSSAEEFKKDFQSFFEDPGRFTYTPVLSCWGKKTSD
jgi:ubiquinone/menaquinone biosynthesis C-methylase UbiE